MAVVPDMGQRLSVAVGIGVAVAPDMGKRLTFATSNSHVAVGACIKDNLEET